MREKPIAENQYQKNTVAVEGGGERIVEDKQSMDIEDVWKRLMLTGELRKANNINRKIVSKNEAIQNMIDAQEIPIYMNESGLQERIQNLNDKLKEKLSREEELMIKKQKELEEKNLRELKEKLKKEIIEEKGGLTN